MYSLVVMGSSIGTKNFASLYVGVPMVNKIGLKDGMSLVTSFHTLAKPYIIPGLEPEGLKSLYCSMEISFFEGRICLEHLLLFSPYGLGDLKLFNCLYEFFETLTCHLEYFLII